MKGTGILIFLLLLLTACNKKTADINTAATADFPNATGNHWHYKYTYNNIVSSIDVDIAGSIVLPDGQNAKVWVYHYPGYVDSMYVAGNDSLVKMFSRYCWTCTPQPLYEHMRYILPLQVGNSWFSVHAGFDTAKVQAISPVNVPAGTFPGAYEITYKRPYVTNTWVYNRLWLVPGVGLVRKEQGEYNLGPMPGNGLWELESYTLY